MKIEGYSGICAICFAPIETGNEVRLRPNGRKFHRDCINKKPSSYYLRLEEKLLKKGAVSIEDIKS